MHRDFCFAGGSARPEYRKAHSKHSVLDMFAFFQFCPIPRESSYFSSDESNNHQVSPAGSRHGKQNSSTKKNPVQNCFAMFFCPAQQPSSAVLEPISEDASIGGTLEDGSNNNKAAPGCLAGIFGGVFKRQESIILSNKESDVESTNNDDDLLNKEDYEQIERQLERALKHSTSSLITYGHKDVVYALKSIHLDRVSSSDFMKELKNEGKYLLQHISSL